jgi:hypothetical protein
MKAGFIIPVIVFGLLACSKTEDKIVFYTLPSLPAVVTFAPADITTNSATLGGRISNLGHRDIIESGIFIYVSAGSQAWGQSPGPRFNEKRTSGNPSDVNFSVFLRGLRPNTTYNYRAFATNEAGTSYGEMLELVTLSPTISTLIVGEN